MSDEPNSDPQTAAIAGEDLDHSITKYRDYSESDRYSVLAAFDMYGGNYHRASVAYSVPVSTIRAWVKAREARGEGPSNLEQERRTKRVSNHTTTRQTSVIRFTPGQTLIKLGAKGAL